MRNCIILIGQNSKLKFDILSILFFLDYIVIANRQIDKKRRLGERVWIKLDIGYCIARSRCNVSFAPAVFLTRAFMAADNKSNARRKENKDVLYRTLRVHYDRSCFFTHDGNCAAIFGNFYVYCVIYEFVM